MTDDTAPCRKCDSTIPSTAARCPECGYEPGSGTLGKVLYYLTLPWAALMAALAIMTVAGVATAAISVGEGMGALVALAVLGGPSWWYVRLHRKRRAQSAAEVA